MKEILNNGGVVAFPTETVYGLGAICTNINGVLNVYKTKQRPPNDPLIVHISNIQMIDQIATIKDYQKQIFDILAQQFWPGPMTIVLEKKPCVPDCCTADQNTVGIRYPNHQIAQQLIQTVGIPIAAPSANKFGHVSGTCQEDIIKEWNGEVKVIDGGRCQVGIESTVLTIKQNNHIHIFRRGGITESMIKKVFDERNIQINITYNQVSQSSLSSPGTLQSHYAVKTAKTYIVTENGLNKVYSTQSQYNKDIIQNVQTCVIMACKLDDIQQILKENFTKLDQKNIQLQQIYDNPTKYFFSSLHFAEALNCKQILIFPPIKYYKEGISQDIDASIFDRMYRSCSGDIIKLQ